jgi:hypothetical protein
MEISAEQFALIEHCLPRQRANVSMTNSPEADGTPRFIWLPRMLDLERP